MPFSGEWAVYKPGDLIYGLEEEENPTRGRYRKLWGVQGASIIDVFPPLQPPSGTKPTKEQVASFHGALQQHPKYSEVYARRGISQFQPLGDAEENRLIRRKSKGGLYWACKVANVDVHFVLDNIDLAGVINKATVVGGEAKDVPQGPAGPKHAATKTRAITGSELRWIYRNRDDEDVAEHIQFWRDKAQVAPPWETDPDAWSAYHPRLQNQPHADHDEGCCGCCAVQ